MLQFTNEFIESVKYIAPGFCAGVPYWICWRIKRSFGDYVMTFLFFGFFFRAVEHLGAMWLTFIFGSPLIFGFWGPDVSMYSLMVIGAVSGIWIGRHLTKTVKEGEEFYPWEPMRAR